MYDVIGALLGSEADERVRTQLFDPKIHPKLHPQSIRSAHLHRGEFYGSEFAQEVGMSNFRDPTFDEACRELLKITQRPRMISFAGGLPAPDVFPIQRFQEACHKVLTQQAASALQYGATEGYEPLRELIANNMARYGIKAKVENVLITSGSQQALDLLGKLFINRGDRVLLEAPTYLGALQAFNMYGAEYVSVPIDEELGEVPFDRFSAENAGLSLLQVLVQRMSVAAVDVDLGEHREADLVGQRAKLADLLFIARFLVPELIAREAEHRKTAIPVLAV